MINQLVEYLEKCSDAYYNSTNTLVSDATYDAMVETLRRLDPSNEYLTRVGAKVKSDKVGRLIPMGTLSKYHREDEVMKWLESEKGEIIVSPKYDGFAVELIYDHGQLVSASTRGDGHVGENVTEAIMNIKNIPHRLQYTMDYLIPDYVIIRGEAIIPTRNHEEAKRLGYVAMRNAVPGIVRSNREDALKLVDFVAYEFLDGTNDRCSQQVTYTLQGFTVEDSRVCDYSDIEYMQQRRKELRESTYYYELDGIVIKTRYIKEDDLLNPSHMIAWKYKSNRETTVLRGIEYQLGVTGYITPIGIFDPVEFQGATLTRASLGNMTRLANDFRGLTIGSLIEVSRRGDIIPYIEELVLIKEDGEKVEPLTVCPHCGKNLEYEDKEPHCVNHACPEKLRLQITQFAKSIGVKGIGDALVRGLINEGYIKSITDIYHMDPNLILKLPRQGQSALNKWNSLREKKLSPVELLTAYPFLNLGRKVWETMLDNFSYMDIMEMTEEKLTTAKLRGIGESKVKDIVHQVSENREELMTLMSIHF